MKDRCGKKCFANRGGVCTVLTEVLKDCPFQRNDITREQQNKDIQEYNSLRSTYGKPIRP